MNAGIKLPVPCIGKAILALVLAIFLTSCSSQPPASAFSLFGGGDSKSHEKFVGEMKKIVADLRPGETVAVACVYDALTRDVTELGNRWRSRIEDALDDAGAKVKVRKDIVIMIDDIRTFGFKVTDVTETEMWRQGYAQVLVVGEYRIFPPESAGLPHRIALDIRAYRVADSGYVEGITWEEDLSPGWENFSALVRANAFFHKWDTVFGEQEDEGPKLSARLDRTPPCYLPETAVTLDIETEPGNYLYVLYFANDADPWLLWPNAHQREPRPLKTGRTTFPPEEFKDKFGIYTCLEEGKEHLPVHETVMVVSSREKLDFSFLPETSHTPYFGISGADVNRVYKVLKNAAGKASAVDLKFTVSNGCQAKKGSKS